jgi:hypothetical protein
LGPNAFLEPNNPEAAFPQISKPNIMDFRSHKLVNRGLTAPRTFRKLNSDRAVKSKYEGSVKTTEEL